MNSPAQSLSKRVSDPSSHAASAVAIDHLVVVAGGKGTRIAEQFGHLPKSLVPVGGKPVLAHLLELAASFGVVAVTILAGYLGDQIAKFVGDGSRFGLRARVLIETEPLGNAGALLPILNSLPAHFFVLYGDVMAAVDLQKIAQFHLDVGADFTGMVHPNDHPLDSDLLEVDSEGRVTAIHAYPHPPGQYFANLVNAALYVVRRDALRPWAEATGKVDFTKDIMSGLIASDARVMAYRSSEYLKDMGTPARLERVEADWQAGKLNWRKSGGSAPAIFLDRDGTLNVEKGFIRRQEDLELLCGAAEALIALRQAGFRLVVLTNQPVIARGEASESDVAAIHRRLEWELGKMGAYLDGIYMCPHHPDSGFPGERADFKIRCECRKPEIALFERACRDHGLDPTWSWMIGDQTRDIEMAKRAGLRSILVQTGAAGHDGHFNVVPDYIAPDIMAAAGIILKNCGLVTR